MASHRDEHIKQAQRRHDPIQHGLQHDPAEPRAGPAGHPVSLPAFDPAQDCNGHVGRNEDSCARHFEGFKEDVQARGFCVWF
ncbi:hypothetical protein BC936DRAFT_144354 [Jimgerdemannia flammicorona]|uniref:Uncharacterized protein n=1 Tax=Jimgerdemannia flammicorona TaxID=994334 RepID=A0A433DCK7_9FUNG|nr:hypothetical protein BC936DRAFT_144354 [Jimgerdemannia flammicorona]